MTIRQWDRREELRGELLDLIVEMMALGRTAEGQNTPEFRRLDQRADGKKRRAGGAQRPVQRSQRAPGAEIPPLSPGKP